MTGDWVKSVFGSPIEKMILTGTMRKLTSVLIELAGNVVSMSYMYVSPWKFPRQWQREKFSEDSGTKSMQFFKGSSSRNTIFPLSRGSTYIYISRAPLRGPVENA